MRLTLSRLKPRPTISNSPITSDPSLSSWLSALKTKQLQHIAQRTGLPSSGTKPVLVAGLERGLAPYCGPFARGISEQNGDHERNEISILSIDMGIRNLAFAHLKCDSFAISPLPLAKENDEAKIVLNAWRRISLPLSRPFTVEEFGRYLDTPPAASHSAYQSGSASESGSTPDSEAGGEAAIGKKQKAKPKDLSKEKESFSLPIYAQHAHSIISTLLMRYNPTHILIERQRFRSGGGAAVQEWSLRVGVFEGMLWAVLGSLRAQAQARFQGALGRDGDRGGGEREEERSGPAWPMVISIEPGRVGRYWLPHGALAAETAIADAKPKKKSKSREGKKVKIDLVGSWLESKTFTIGEDGVEPWVNGYMSKWKKEKPARTKTKSKLRRREGSAVDGDEWGGKDDTLGVDIGKLDDLADCVVQGVTWLEWEEMRGKVVAAGTDASGLELP